MTRMGDRLEHLPDQDARDTKRGGNTGRRMGRITILLVGVFGLAVLSGCLFLAFGNFPVPTAPVEKVLPDARFPK